MQQLYICLYGCNNISIYMCVYLHIYLCMYVILLCHCEVNVNLKKKNFYEFKTIKIHDLYSKK